MLRTLGAVVLCFGFISSLSSASAAGGTQILGFASSSVALPTGLSLRNGVCKTSGRAEITMAAQSNGQKSIDRKQFVQLAAAWLVGTSAAAPALATEKLKCKAQIGGGQKCEATKEIKFTKAYDTAGSATKVTGDPNKMSTFYSQIHAGLETLEELNEKWDAYIEAGDGDVVRRRLGTVGNKSPLHNIRKAFEGALKVAAKSPGFEPEELDLLDEDFNAILQGIAEVDYNLYSTAFVGTDETASKLRADGKTSLLRALKLYRKFDAECAKVV